MLDLGLLAVVAWCVFAGLSLGAFRTLVALSAFVGAVFVVELGSPWLRLLDSVESIGGAGEWLRRVLAPDIPAFARVQLQALEVGWMRVAPLLRTVYLQVNLVCYAVAVATGFLLALRSIETLWTAGAMRRSSRGAGGLLGFLLGVFSVGFLLRIIAFAGWWLHAPSITALARRSMLFGMWGHWLALHHHGIFF